MRKGVVFRKAWQFLQSPDHKRVIGNIFSLSGLQVANSLLPLITIPYVVRVVGPAKYGLISFAQAFAAYFLLIVNYGFDLSASRKISIVRHDRAKVAEIFWSVLWTKIFLFLGSSILFLLVMLLVPQLREDAPVMVSSYLVVAGFVLFPTWLFQGVEKLGLTALFNFLVKLIFTAGVFIFLKKADDYLVVPVMLSAGQLVAGCYALFFGLKTLVGRFEFPSIQSIVTSLREGWGVFLSVAFMNLYTASNIVILGFFSPQENVGYFAGGVKIVMAVHTLVFYPISQAAYPHSSRLISEDFFKGSRYLRRMLIAVAGISLPISCFLFFGAPLLVKIVLGPQYEPAVIVVRLLSAFPLILGLGNVFGIQGILGMSLDKTFLKVIGVGLVINLALNFLLDPLFQEVGSSMAWIATEIYVTVGLFVALRKAGMRIIDPAEVKGWFMRRN